MMTLVDFLFGLIALVVAIVMGVRIHQRKNHNGETKTFHIIRCGDGYVGNEAYICNVEAISESDALNVFARNCGHLNFCRMARYCKAYGISYKALERNNENA